MKRRFSPKQYAERLRRQRRRLYLQDGVLSVRFIKFFGEQPSVGATLPDAPELSPDRDPDRCPWCGCPTDPDDYCEICGHHNFLIHPSAKSAALPEPEPKHDEGCQCHLCWARSLSQGGITPPWPGGAA